jgi:hypothetical protein
MPMLPSINMGGGTNIGDEKKNWRSAEKEVQAWLNNPNYCPQIEYNVYNQFRNDEPRPIMFFMVVKMWDTNRSQNPIRGISLKCDNESGKCWLIHADDKDVVG